MLPDDLRNLEYIVTQVFCPLRLPDGNDHTVHNEYSLAEAVCGTVRAYTKHISSANVPQWNSFAKMLENLHTAIQFEGLDNGEVKSQLSRMGMGDILAFFIRAQNAAVFFTKQEHTTLCESFEVSPTANAVMGAQGKLICSYPGPAIQVPNHIFHDGTFLSELVTFLAHMHEDGLNSAAERDPAHPRYITELLTGILCAVGRPVDTVRISKRIGDDVVGNSTSSPWRRSPLWLLVRVALQTSLSRSALGVDSYKEFMLFFMCKLAGKAVSANLSNDLLHCMSAKISRRLGKLGSAACEWVSSVALQTCQKLRSVLEQRWAVVQAMQSASPAWASSDLDPDQDTRLSLLHSRDYIHNTLTNHLPHSTKTTFNPNHHPRGNLDGFLDSAGNFFKKAYQAEPQVALYDLETAVEWGIDDWIDRVTDADEASVEIEILANAYSSYAKRTYENRPEHLSIMLLTLIELWIALDILAVKTIPMLADYTPEVPVSLLENLLVTKSTSFHRLRKAHLYLSGRHARSRGWSVFSDSVSTDNFAVRYYSRCRRLQALKSRIENAARYEVDNKTDELAQVNSLYSQLQRQAADVDHEFAIDDNGEEYHAKGRCYKCELEARMRSMEIEIHKWPLPAESLAAMVVVFELDPPLSFNMWRSATFHLLDHSSVSLTAKSLSTLLDEYDSLRPYFVKHPRSRISLGLHRRPIVEKRRIPAQQDQVCVPNDLRFHACDTYSRTLILQPPGNTVASLPCIHQLPLGPYHNLQRYLAGTSHMSNEVLANQADCHKELSIHEFIAFGHLRSGASLQWLNILRELRSRTLSFRRHEVLLLLAQAAAQVGCLSDTGELIWHQELGESSFCYALLEELHNLVMTVEANWSEGVTMSTVTYLIGRLLASKPEHGVVRRAFSLLQTVREKTFGWVQDLSGMLTNLADDTELCGFFRDMAAVCRGAFDVEFSVVQKLLHSPEAIDALFSCAIYIHDNVPSDISSISPLSQLLLERDCRLSLALEGILCDILHVDATQEGINRAIRRIWPSYRPGSRWQRLQDSNARWLTCETAATQSQCSQIVHFNMLDGSLLVDGKPLRRLPNEILCHPLFCLIFGKQMIDVVPSDMAGMAYSTRSLISGHQVHFTLRDDDLVIRAKNSDATVELIPPEKLEHDLPAVLVKGHAHWLNRSTSIVEIRRLDRLWEHSPDNWELACTNEGYSMRKGGQRLVDIRSATWTKFSSLLKPLEAPENLLVTVSPDGAKEQISVTLPRYGLSFFVDEEGELQSRNLRGMVYDSDQSVGTLFGLVNQLVLRPKLQLGLEARCVLIPDGDVAFTKDGHHVRVSIDTHHSLLQPVTYQVYRVDGELGCLKGNVTLTNKLYLAYLHALTSAGCNTDPLTGRTGTEEALSIIRSWGCRSFMKVEPRDAQLLGLIASLCPSRSLHSSPPVQSVHWQDLPDTSQHPELYLAAKAIKDHCNLVRPFQQDRDTHLFHDFPQRDNHLLERSALRMAYLLSCDFSRQRSREDCDVKYQGRDSVHRSSGEHRAHTAAYAVYHRSAKTPTVKDLATMVESWKATLQGKASLSLRYDSSWLKPDLPTIWIEAYNQLRRSAASESFQLLFSLPAMAYDSPTLSNLVPIFIAFAVHPDFRSEEPPNYTSYKLSDGCTPDRDTLRSYALDSARSFEESPESSSPSHYGESHRDLIRRRRRAWNDRRNSDVDALVITVLEAWPSEVPSEISLNPQLYRVENLKTKLKRLFSSCYRNLQLMQHLKRVQSMLTPVCLQGLPPPSSRYTFEPARSAPPRSSPLPTVDELFSRSTPSLPNPPKLLTCTIGVEAASSDHSPLSRLLANFQRHAKTPFQSQYVTDLRASTEHLCSEAETPFASAERHTTHALMDHYRRCSASFSEGLDVLNQALGPSPGSKSEQALSRAGQWPRITAYVLFQCLASTSPIPLSEDWKKCLIQFALLALEVQRSRRLVQLLSTNLSEEFSRELANPGCDGWDAEQYPDWLLIQLQGNLLVRRLQVDIAMHMILPHSNENTTMQLHMGEGKSSVIVPAVASVLAHGKQMLRVVVPKALTAQMFQILVDRLGGLVNRPIYYLPFSRSLELKSTQVATLHSIMKECMKERGVLVVQPEHILSLKLVSVEKQLSRKSGNKLADRLLKLQRWLHSRARDVLDESDEILHVRYQLVYTIGSQRAMDGCPERWTTTQQILSLVKKHAPSICDLFPLGVVHETNTKGAFPHFRILDDRAGKELIHRIALDVMEGLLPNFGFEHLHPELRGSIYEFISRKDIPVITADMVQAYAARSTLWNGLLLLRGLLATGILIFAFEERRWRVDYGLAPERTMLAVPYRAKDVPAQRAEFGHPDIAIILTCLSYYYHGLTEEQLKSAFELLLTEADPSIEYDHWVRDNRLVTGPLRDFSNVNITSAEHWNQDILPFFSQNQETIDFYLSRVVFPKEAKEFPSKLSCSGWDLAEKRDQLVTGFSGTNDGRYLLPYSITQHDPNHQKGTNARVLSYLLQPENSQYMLVTSENGTRRNTLEFLRTIVAQMSEIRVLLDVGAQILDLQNQQVASTWLELSPTPSAAIYFNEHDELAVLTRDGRTQLLLSSPFGQQLDQCVIYLDDAHTRGTDIKFPLGFRAAVTLGPKVTKDRLVQGCMRMRKLGHGHSVMFFAPRETDQSIRNLVGKGVHDIIDAGDILHWAVRETCNDIQRRAPQWAQQGMDHISRYHAWTSFLGGDLAPKDLSVDWLQPEAKSLVDLYSPHPSDTSTTVTDPEILRRCESLGGLPLRDSGMDEEQEKEVIHELERERQVERPARASPAAHSIHPDIVAFVKTGVLPARSDVVRPVFKTLSATSAVIDEAPMWSRFVLATQDFSTTTTLPSDAKQDQYMRPVQWIVSSKQLRDDLLVILSPHEVSYLLPYIRSSKYVHLHLYTPRTSRSMIPCDDLKLYTVPTIPYHWSPPWLLVDQLNVFGGQLYLRDRAAYLQLCRFLCLYTRGLKGENGVEVDRESDGFILPKNRPPSMEKIFAFQHSPLPALRPLFALRRKGMSFSMTHMGKIVGGRLLTELDFDD